MKYWLVKSEPETYSIDNLKRDKVTDWSGVRNYQARNFLREMKAGDQVLFYHSSCEVPGVVGVAKVRKDAYPDKLQYDKKSDYYDAKATVENPRWYSPDIAFVKRFDNVVALPTLKNIRELSEFQLLKPGNRLSVLPVSKAQFEKILKVAQG